MKVISTEKAPGAIGPYSQGYIANGFIFTSGQLGIDAETGKYKDCIKWQTENPVKMLKRY